MRPATTRCGKSRRRSPRRPSPPPTAFYGPTNEVATKVAVGIVLHDEAGPESIERWNTDGDEIRQDSDVLAGVVEFLKSHSVRSVVTTEKIIGCPHEEGIDYPEGEPCPRCPYWKNRDRWMDELLRDE